MKRSLPPLNGLRAFEAAARHMSFTDAAEELSVTQAAISHQVRGLGTKARIKIVRAPQSLAPAVGSGSGLSAGSAVGVRSAQRSHREAPAEGSWRSPHGNDHLFLCHEVAGTAAGWLPARQSGDRRPDLDRHVAGRVLARGCRHRHPLWARPVAEPGGRAAGRRGRDAGLRAVAGQGAERTQEACRPQALHAPAQHQLP